MIRLLGALLIAGLVIVMMACFVITIFWTAWNELIPSVFGGPGLSWRQSGLAIVLLAIIGTCFRASITIKKN